MSYIIGKFSADGVDLQRDTFEIYQKIFQMLSPEYPYLIKCHNFVPNILGQHRYDKFNLGRHQAFLDAGYKYHPAATAVSSITDYLEISYSIGQQLPVEIYNPNQDNPYDYPTKSKPIFARAVKTLDQIYISGTASIIGNKSVYIDNLLDQYNQTLENLRLVADSRPLETFNFIVYIKYAADVEVIKSIFPYPARYIVCDICREELLIEIEATTKNGNDLTALYS